MLRGIAARLKAAATAAGAFMGLTDGAGNRLPMAYTIAQSAIPVILAPSGTVAADGTITLLTALQVVYPSAWLRLPAGAVSGGAAGLYYCVFSSATVGSVKTNYADPASTFVPFIPAGPLVSAVGSGLAYTQTTGADITLVNVLVPANSLSATGQLRITVQNGQNSSAGTKTHQSKVNGTSIHSRARTTILLEGWYGVLHNRGSQSVQVTLLNQYTGEPVAAGSGASQIFAFNTAADISLTITINIAVATDFGFVEFFNIEVLP